MCCVFLPSNKRPKILTWVALLVVAINVLCNVTHSRNIHGHSRFGRPRADPHVVNPNPTSVEVKTKDSAKNGGRRCQVTKLEEKERFFEMPYYQEGRVVFPFFVKISGKLPIKKGTYVL